MFNKKNQKLQITAAAHPSSYHGTSPWFIRGSLKSLGTYMLIVNSYDQIFSGVFFYKFINIFVRILLIFRNNQDIKTNHFETENRFALNFSFGY